MQVVCKAPVMIECGLFTLTFLAHADFQRTFRRAAVALNRAPSGPIHASPKTSFEVLTIERYAK